MIRVLVACKNPYTAKKIELSLDEKIINVISYSFNVEQLNNSLNNQRPDLCIIDQKLLTIKSDYNTILSKYKIPILLVVDDAQNNNIQSHPLFNVIDESHMNDYFLTNIIKYMVKVSMHFTRINNEYYSLKRENSSMKLLNKAKQLLIRYEGFSEAEAHKFILNKSMQKRISKEKYSENVINKYKPFS